MACRTASFLPNAQIATLRAYLLQRKRLVEYVAAHIQHMQKVLIEINLQLHHVVSDTTVVTGIKINRATVSGERDPNVLAGTRYEVRVPYKAPLDLGRIVVALQSCKFSDRTYGARRV